MPLDLAAAVSVLESAASDARLDPGVRNDAALLAEQFKHLAPPPAPTAAREETPSDAARVAERTTTWMAGAGQATQAELLRGINVAATELGPGRAQGPLASALEGAAGIVRRRDMLPLPGYLCDVGARIEREYRGVLELEGPLDALGKVIALTPESDQLGRALRAHYGETVRRFVALRERVAQ